jgi:acyl dehydratase
VIGAGVEVSWAIPTRPGDILHVDITLTDITPSRSKPDRSIVTILSETKNQDGGLCQRMTAKLLVFRKPGD